MKLNSKGFSLFSLLIAIGAVVVCYLLTLPRHNDFADIPAMKATRTVDSDHERMKVRAGEEFRVVAIHKAYSERDKKQTMMILVQNARGERDWYNRDLISEEEYQEMLPLLTDYSYSETPALFCRKTVSKEALEAIPMGISVEEMDKRLVPTDRVVTEDGFLRAEYDRMEVFDKESGKFYKPAMKFKDGEYCGFELETYRKTHLNAWLLKFLPGTKWVYDHNLFNAGFAKKAFGKMSLKESKSVTMRDNFFLWLMLMAAAILFLVVIFAFYAFIPLVLAYFFYGLLFFPPIFKLFNSKLTDIIVVLLAIVGYYYCWLTFMPYMSFFLMPCIMVPAAIYGVERLRKDEICNKCKYMNTIVFDHDELLGEKLTSCKETGRRRKVDSRKVGSHETWKETTTTTTNARTHEVLSQYTSKSDLKRYNDYEDTYETDRYNCVYLVKTIKTYYRCTECGNITHWIHDEWTLQSKEYADTRVTTSNRSERR